MGSRQVTVYAPIVTAAASAKETALHKQLDRRFDLRLEKQVEELMHQRAEKDGHNRTGIFFPESYVPGPTLDLIVYFHGLLDRCGGSTSDTVEKYWTNPHFRLRELVNDGKKNVVLVVPRLGPMDDTGSKLGMSGDAFLTKVQAVISERIKEEPFKSTGETKIRTIYLAAHSGGGLTMLRLAQTVTVGKVRECWGFDSMYQLPREWVNWAATGGKYFLFWTDEGGINTDYYGNNVDTILKILGNTKDPTSALAVPNVVVEYTLKPKTFPKSTKEHCEVPRTYWADLMKRLP
jgi:hypothetical protein